MQPSTLINRTHCINSEYFQKIDTEEKAYWLGFLWADGNIVKTNPRSSGPNRLRLAQKWEEKHHIEKFNQAISSNYPIYLIQHENNHTVAQLDINCRPMCESLQKLGYSVKTKRTHIPCIKKSLLHHFIRGYFDGDGCLSLYVQHIDKWAVCKQEWSITGNKELMNEIKSVLTLNADVTPSVKMKLYKNSPESASIRYSKKTDIQKLYDYLYENATVYLESKHQKFVDFFSRYTS